jgi:Ni/Co efflux regulator RcnB
MKSTLYTAVPAIALLALVGLTPASAQPGQDRQAQHGQYEGPSVRAQQQDADHSDDRDNRQNWRDSRADARWDEARHNGFYIGNRWSYGPPTLVHVRRGAVPGYQPWAVGRNLGQYNRRFEEVDYRREQLREPPRGYRWVSDGRGGLLLAGARSGRIIEVAASGRQLHEARQPWRDERVDARWDDNRHNGYYRNDRWTYGPPPPGQTRAAVVLGYQPWSRGQRLGYYQGRFAEVDYRSRQDLRPPPLGYHWVRDDSGDYLLADIGSGLISQVVLGGAR